MAFGLIGGAAGIPRSHANSGSLLPADSLELVVLEQNVRALRWYHRLGFRVCGLCVKPLIQGERQMVAYIHMMWCREGGKPPRRFFDDELVGERLRLVSEVLATSWGGARGGLHRRSMSHVSSRARGSMSG